MNKNGWILVSEKLPKPNEHVLLFLKNNEGKKAQVVGYLYYSKNENLQKCNNEFSAFDGGAMPVFLKKEYVIAWQPLPDPIL